MTEILLGTFVIVVLVLGLATGLLVLRARLVPSGGLDILVNDSLHIHAKRGDKLLEALHNADIRIPAACGGKGTCGLCRVTVSGDGAGIPLATERGILSPKERRDHVRLACQTTLRGDAAVQVPEGMIGAGGGLFLHRGLDPDAGPADPRDCPGPARGSAFDVPRWRLHATCCPAVSAGFRDL